MALKRLLLAIPAWAAGAEAAAANEVWVVAPMLGPGVDFTSIQAAIDAAGEGDTVLLRSGLYFPGWTIQGKSLTLEVDVGQSVQCYLGTIRDLGATQWVVVRGLGVDSGIANYASALELLDNAGSVWIEEHHMSTSVGGFIPPPAVPGIRATNCAAVTVADSDVVGVQGQLGIDGFPGIQAAASTVHVWDSTVRGGSGFSYAGIGGATQGGTGIELDGGFLFLSGASATGGSGGQNGGVFGCTSGLPGGVGLVQHGTMPVTVRIDSQLLGGAKGCTFGGPQLSPDFDIQSGELQVLPGTARSFTAASPAREGELLGFTLSGEPGDLAFYGLAVAPAALYIEPFFGTFALGGGVSVFFAGAVPAGGTITQSVLVPNQGPGVEAQQLYYQAGFVTPSLELRLSSPSAVTLLDAAL